MCTLPPLEAIRRGKDFMAEYFGVVYNSLVDSRFPISTLIGEKVGDAVTRPQIQVFLDAHKKTEKVIDLNSLAMHTKNQLQPTDITMYVFFLPGVDRHDISGIIKKMIGVCIGDLKPGGPIVIGQNELVNNSITRYNEYNSPMSSEKLILDSPSIVHAISNTMLDHYSITHLEFLRKSREFMYAWYYAIAMC